MWKIVKKILRTIALWLPLCSMVISVAALSPVDTTNNPHHYVTYRYDKRWLTDGQTFRVVDAFKRDSFPIELRPSNNSAFASAIAMWNSYLLEDNYYYLELSFDTPFPTGETGNTVESAIQGLALSSDEFFENSSTSYFYHIEDDYYSGFYDKTAKKLYYIMYLSKEFFDEHPQLRTHNYIHILLGQWDTEMISIKTIAYSGMEIRAPYTQILKEIRDKLDGSGGGGLTAEEVQAAVVAALEQHEAAEEQKANNKLQQIKQQIESITEPYKENLTSLQDATRSITASLNYSGTTAVLKLPEARNPMTNNSLLWEEKEIDLGYYWEQLPQALRSAITIILTFLILYKVIIEMVDEITWVIYMDKNVDKAERNAIGL